MTTLESSQAVIAKNYLKYKNTKLMELMKNIGVVRTVLLEICEHFDKKHDYSTMTRDLFVATLEDEYTLGEFLINYDLEMEVLGEKFLKWLDAN